MHACTTSLPVRVFADLMSVLSVFCYCYEGVLNSHTENEGVLSAIL